ncbi:hypothetical protein AJ79_02000 [Helicocarpus griseus UAMH5409]|uniref:3-keto-steroid reductase n=1 Tax=Helicocarpus griseus UAMH5409 TaxID=1447875 RepID=A0A2B7Y457_9EURO|nr:hypothetical protein AJ79_02000 [Helicocarpus griseus UAMH5409]
MSSNDLLSGSAGSDETYILVTGTNSGIGFSICCRIIDEFLSTRPPSHSLTLLFTTRSSKKSSETLSGLQDRLTSSAAKHSISKPRVTLIPEHVDLGDLLSVRALARRLLTTLPKLDSIVLNAGIAGFTGLNWFKAIYMFLTELVNAATWPARYTLSDTGVLAKKQTSQPDEPALGHIFCANVFGHYMLSHALMPLLSATSTASPGRIIWTSSLEATREAFSVADLQGLKTRHAYESSKYLTDVLALTSNLPSTAPWVDSFLSPTSSTELLGSKQQEQEQPPQKQKKQQQTTKPNLYLAHPGISATSIMPLPFPLFYAMVAAFWCARFLGSPWHVISAYNGACAAVWLSLSPQPLIDAAEGAYARSGGGKAKWGSSSDRLGRVKPASTEVEGWGYGGVVGRAVLEEDRRRRRKDGAKDLTEEARVGFEEMGRACWAEMEELRVLWEEILEREERERGVVDN